MIQVTREREEKDSKKTQRDRGQSSSLLVSVQSDSFCYLSLSCSARNSDSSVLSAV